MSGTGLVVVCPVPRAATCMLKCGPLLTPCSLGQNCVLMDLISRDEFLHFSN